MKRKLVFAIVLVFGLFMTSNLIADDWYNVGSAGFSENSFYSFDLTINANNIPYIIYGRDEANDNKATVMKYNGATWEVVGTSAFTTAYAEDVNISIDASGTPYVGYIGSAGNGIVMKYNGTLWETVGGANISSAGYSLSLALNTSGTPYVALSDFSQPTRRATVKKFNGSSWELVGSAGFSAGEARYTRLAIDASGTVYVAFVDFATSQKATVMKFNGSSWEIVGTAGFSTRVIGRLDLEVDNFGTPYIAFQDRTFFDGSVSQYEITVMAFNGSLWEAVGTEAFTTNYADYPSLAFDSNNTPYVAYKDEGYAGKASIMKFNGSSWESVGTAGFSAGIANFTTVALTSSNIPIVGYLDYGTNIKSTVMKYAPSSDTPLPIELSSFIADAVNGKVILEWITETETENQGFILERRLLGNMEWECVADYQYDLELISNGNSTETHQYEYTDNDVQSGCNYEYRLGDVDYAGKVRWHNIVNIDVPKETENMPASFGLLNAYPNPFNPSVNISYSLENETQTELSVYDIQGNLVETLVNDMISAGTHNMLWQAMNIGTGIYIVRLNADNNSSIQKIVYMK